MKQATDLTGGQLVHDHWKLILRLTNDEDEAQRLALHVLEKFDQFTPERSAFAQFIKLKLRELRQHYADKGVVSHPCRKKAAGYVSFDESQDPDGTSGDDEEVELNLHNALAAPSAPIRLDLSGLPKRQRRIMQLRFAGYTQEEVAKKEGVSIARISQIEEAAESGICIDEVTEIYHEETGRRRHYCETLNDLGRCPEPVKLRPRRKRVSREAFQRELQAQATDAPRMAGRIYYAERVTGARALPKDTLWEKKVPDFLKQYWANILKGVVPLSHLLMGARRPAWSCAWRRAACSPWRGDLTKWWSWHRLDGLDEWEGLAYLRAYLGRNGLACRSASRCGKRHSPFLAWLTKSETDQRRVPRKRPSEDTTLLWIAIELLLHRRRRWPRGIPKRKLFPDDKFTPRERLLRQGQALIAADRKPRRWRRPLIRELTYPKKGPKYEALAA